MQWNKKKCKTIRCAKNNKMCKKQQDVQKTTRCAKNNKMCKKRKTVYWDLINSNVNKRDVQTGCSGLVQIYHLVYHLPL